MVPYGVSGDHWRSGSHAKSTGMMTEARMELIAADQALEFLRECEMTPATSLRPGGSVEPPVSPP